MLSAVQAKRHDLLQRSETEFSESNLRRRSLNCIVEWSMVEWSSTPGVV